MRSGIRCVSVFTFAICVCMHVASLSAQISTGGRRDEQLQAAFRQFPLLSPATNSEGKPQFQTLHPGDPVVVKGVNYYGFRFKVPPRENGEDFVWAVIEPPTMIAWYILPETGVMNGFERYCHVPKTKYLQTSHLIPLNQRVLILQSLSGDYLKDGETYLIWWSLRGNPRPESLSFTFARLGQNGLDKLHPMEKALGLVPAAAPQTDRDDLNEN